MNTNRPRRGSHCCARGRRLSLRNESAYQPTRGTAITEPEPMPTVPKILTAIAPRSHKFPANLPQPRGTIREYWSEKRSFTSRAPATKPTYPPTHRTTCAPTVSNDRFPIFNFPRPPHTFCTLRSKRRRQKTFPLPPSRLPPYLRLTPYYLRPTPPPPPPQKLKLQDSPPGPPP